MDRVAVVTGASGVLGRAIVDAASFVTGAVVPVDGGFDAFSGV